MDTDLRDVLREIKERQQDSMARLEAKIDASNSMMNAHIITSATNYEKVTASLVRAHERIDDTDLKIEKHKAWHKEERTRWWGVWTGLAIALVASLWDLVKKIFSR